MAFLGSIHAVMKGDKKEGQPKRIILLARCGCDSCLPRIFQNTLYTRPFCEAGS